MARVYAPYYDRFDYHLDQPLVSSKDTGGWGEGFFEKVGLPQDIISSNIGNVYGFDGNKSNIVGCIPLEITIMTKCVKFPI